MEIPWKFWNRLLDITKINRRGWNKIRGGELENFKKINNRVEVGNYSVHESKYLFKGSHKDNKTASMCIVLVSSSFTLNRYLPKARLQSFPVPVISIILKTNRDIYAELPRYSPCFHKGKKNME